MKVTLDQIKKLLATYKMKVLRIQPMDHGFFVETNKGKKIVSIWENAELLKWSNGWREQVKAQGYDQIERFLTNSNRKKYIRYQGKFFVVSDAQAGNPPDPVNPGDCRNVGELFARCHQAMDRIDEKVVPANVTEVDVDYFQKGSEQVKQVMQQIEQKSSPTLVDEVIYSNLPLLYKRFCRVYQLWENVKDSISFFPAAFEQFELSQFSRTANGKWHIGGGYNQPPCPMHQDTVRLIREIYEKSNWNLASVTTFLEGYEQHRKFTDNELVYILLQLAIPWEVWNHFTDYLSNPNWTEQQVEALMADIDRQRHWDDLAVHVGRLIDQRRERLA